MANAAIMPKGERSGANFVFSFSRDKAAQGEIAAIIEHAPDPTAVVWTPALPGMVQVLDRGDWESVTVVIPASAPRLFVRLRVP